MMRSITLDTAACLTQECLHEAIQRQLGFPSHYGKNLDALWDCLTGEVPLPLTVEWVGYPEARRAIGEHVDKVLATFRDAETETGELKVILR